MPVHDDLGRRMKSFYEEVPNIRLMRRTPVICRLDMRAGHLFTRGFKRPFDEIFIRSIQDTAKYLAENVMGCRLTYQQSDEISLLLIDYERLNSEAFFDYRVQKLCSVIASAATLAFNKAFTQRFIEINPTFAFYDDEPDNTYKLAESYGFNPRTKEGMDELEKYVKIYDEATDKGATFDCRVFNIPGSEVTNYFYWRQLDATRNSIQMVGQANFSHTQLHEKTCNDIQEMLHEKCGINWNDFPTYQKRGSCCVKEKYDFLLDTYNDEIIQRSRWIIDNEIPIFRGDGREYIEKLVNVGE